MKRNILSPVLGLIVTTSAVGEVKELKPSSFVTFNSDHSIQELCPSPRQLWGIDRNSSALFRWDGETRTWKATPVKAEAWPVWERRSSPPWHRWAGPPICFKGSDGAILAVVFSDIYQSKSKADIGYEVPKIGELPREEFWPDAWLFRNGKWSERKRLLSFLTEEHAYLVKNFAESVTIRPSTLDLQVCGDVIWITYDGEVSAYGSRGKIATWHRPKEWERGAETWLANLVRLMDGTLWYAFGSKVVPLSLDGDRIVAAPPIELPEYLSASGHNIRVTRGGNIWLHDGLPHRFRDGHWERVNGVGELTFEDVNGELWFLPGGGEGTHSDKGYTILKDGKTYRVPLPGHFQKCTVTAVERDVLIASGGDRLIVLERCAVEPGWTIRSVLGVKGFYVCGPVWVDDHGNLVSYGWSAKLPGGFLP